jgi:hypothetical protein
MWSKSRKPALSHNGFDLLRPENTTMVTAKVLRKGIRYGKCRVRFRAERANPG